MQSRTVSTRPGSLVLASASPRRRHLIGIFGLPFDVAVADVDETPRSGEAADALAMRLARDKALAVADRRPTRTVLAADTVVALDGRLLGKPVDADEARSMLRALRDRPHQVVTGLALAIGRGEGGADTGEEAGGGGADSVGGQGDRGAGLIWHAAVETLVEMRAYTDEDIERYVLTGRPLDKAGGYAIQDNEIAPVARITGCYPNVVGLPLCETRRALAAAGLLGEVGPDAVGIIGSATPACRLCGVAREMEPPA